ncbi:protein of unknown function (plasmid) [Cupriavidus neocaledonicus]|uniref:Uncharacterized protein n=1 Tax=Cupriavidus neocaledonicus TaxID=1040979 RepID=A0A375HUQ1_9BURK|nr:hypothetical protein CBM2605_B70050 [Cupriavidus neocaledonicus]SPD60604.1 protein of unknown function [Cupriavidus neocaledonicus]
MRAGAGKADGLHFVEAPALTPNPLPQAGEGAPSRRCKRRGSGGRGRFSRDKPVSPIVPTRTTASSSVPPRACP